MSENHSGIMAPEQVATPQEEPQVRNPIITPADNERWPLLEMESQPCSIPISSDDEQVIGYMDSLLDQLDEEAAGLAAIQIGYPRRIFLLRNRTIIEAGSLRQRTENTVYINPVILGMSREQKKDGEACLSLPGMVARFGRPKNVTLGYFDITGTWKTEVFIGFWARAVCHEMAHLNGKLIMHELEKEIARQPKRTKFGMIIDHASRNRINSRRNKNKHAKYARRKNRIGH